MSRRPIPETERLTSANVMARITFIQKDGTERVVEAEPGMTVMEAGIRNMKIGIVMFMFGLVGSGALFAFAQNVTGGRFVVLWYGGIIAGLIMLFRGFAQYGRGRRSSG